jgi:hypothetical protein
VKWIIGARAKLQTKPLLSQLAENQISADEFKRVTTFSSAFAG